MLVCRYAEASLTPSMPLPRGMAAAFIAPMIEERAGSFSIRRSDPLSGMGRCVAILTILTGSMSFPPSFTSPKMVARPSVPTCWAIAFMSIITHCGSIPPTQIISCSATMGAYISRTMVECIGATSGICQSCSFLKSVSTCRSPSIMSTGAPRTTCHGVARVRRVIMTASSTTIGI